jgi:hypothetical protein
MFRCEIVVKTESSDMGIGLKSRSSIVGYVNEGSNCTRQYVNVVETGKRTSLWKEIRRNGSVVETISVEGLAGDF